MNFYRMEPKYGEEVGKTFPQSQDVISDMHYGSPNHLRNVWGKFPEDVYIPDSILHPKAKVTDWISSSPITYPIISVKLKDILEKNRTDGIQYCPTHLIVKKQKLKYWLINGYKHDYQYINFQQSIINKIGPGFARISTLDIKSAEGLKVAIQSIVSPSSPESVWIEKLELVESIPDNLFFLDRVNGSNYYISETLKLEIEAAGCTGIAFIPYDEVYP